MGYLADFVTGRSINQHDDVVALVIVPAAHGYPNPVTGAAKPPVYVADRFEPLSLPMRGKLDDRGFFEPNADDLGLEILLSAVKANSWKEFADKGINDFQNAWTFPDPTVFDKENVTSIHPGIAAMHASTFDALIAAGSYFDDAEGGSEPERAAAIVVDARKRWNEGRDSKYYNAAYMHAPNGSEYVTLEGETIKVPFLMQVLSDMDGNQSMSSWLKSAVTRRHDRNRSDQQQALVATYRLLHDFFRASYGLHDLPRYWQPSGYARSENLEAVAKLQIADLQASLGGVTDRLGIEEATDRGFSGLEAMADDLRKALETIEAEIASVRSNSPSM